MAANPEGFNTDIPLPPDLKIAHIRKTIEFIERETAEFVDVYFEQANVFSGLVGIFGARAVAISPRRRSKR